VASRDFLEVSTEKTPGKENDIVSSPVHSLFSKTTTSHKHLQHNLSYSKQNNTLTKLAPTIHLPNNKYRGADKSLARPGTKQTTGTEDSEFRVSYLQS
jgi:hypothetical protein